MPNLFGTSQSSSHNRRGGSARHRENRIQPTSMSPMPNPRLTSCSPDSRAVDEMLQMAPSDAHNGSTRKKKRGQNSNANVNANAGSSVAVDSQVGDRGRFRAKSRSKAAHASMDDGESVASRNERAPTNAKSKRRDRSKSRDATQRLSRRASSSDLDEREQNVYTGPIAHADFNRMKEELEETKKVSCYDFLCGVFIESFDEATIRGQEDYHEAKQGIDI